MDKTLEEKIRIRINKSNKAAFVTSDFFDFLQRSQRDQIGRVLRKLTRREELIKIGQGVYVKTKKSKFSNKKVIVKDFPTVAREALKKMNVVIVPSTAEKEYNSGKSSQIPSGLMVGVQQRVSRKLSYNGRTIKYEQVAN